MENNKININKKHCEVGNENSVMKNEKKVMNNETNIMKKKKITVIGCGRWGSFLAWYSNHIGHSVTVWGRSDSKSFLTLQHTHENEYVKLDDEIKFESDIAKALSNADIVIISISSQQLRSFLSSIDKSLLLNKKVVLCMKGIETATGKRLSEVAIECGVDKNNLAVWLGPGHIQEFVKGTPNCMTIDSYNENTTLELVECFHSPLIRFYFGNDMIGNEIGGATKNIIGIAAGMLDGCGYTSLKGPLMSRGVREVSRLIVALGGHEQTAYGLTHLGDYETTLFSKFSNNRAFGEKFIKGEAFDKLAEGVMTTKAVIELAKKYNVEMPITNCIYNLLFEKADPAVQLKMLFDRDVKHEF